MLRYKLLANQLESAVEELRISSEIAITASKQVESLFNSHLESMGETPHPAQKVDLDTQEEALEPSQATKSIFRKIATKIHPDKLAHLEQTPDVLQKAGLYEKAQKAYNKDHFIILLDIADELQIQTSELSEIDLVNTENKIRSVKQELERLHSTLVWRWNMSYNKEEKDLILKELFRLLHERHKNKSTGA